VVVERVHRHAVEVAHAVEQRAVGDRAARMRVGVEQQDHGAEVCQ